MKRIHWTIASALSLAAGLLCALSLAVPLVAQAVAAPGALPPSASINYAAALALGAVGAIVTHGVGKVAGVVDARAGAIDDGLRHKLGPTFPMIAGAFGLLLAPLAARVGWHVTADDAQAVQAFPVMGLAGVVIREAARKWLAPALGIRTSSQNSV